MTPLPDRPPEDLSTRRYSYSPIVDRPRLELPNGARAAVWVVPNIEHYEYLPAEVRVRNPWPRTPHPDVLGYGGRDYGNRVGLWRMFEVLDKHEIRCTVSLSMSVIEMYPRIFEAMETRRWEYMSHGLYNTRYHWGYGEDEERAAIAHCKVIHQRLTGRPLKGWFSPAVSFTRNTADLVAEAELQYICDFYHDDQPTPLRTKHGPLISVPYSMDLNDAMVYRQPVEAEEFARMVTDHFDTIYREGESQPRVMCVALHPYMMGAPHRIRHLDRALAHIRAHRDVWIATGGEIADWYAQAAMPAFQAHLGAEA
jgi:allantoinase